MEDEDYDYRMVCVETCDGMKTRFVEFHKGSVLNIQADKDKKACFTVADFMKLLVTALKHEADEDALVKALSKYGALCMGDILEDWGRLFAGPH